ncbi:nitrate- and nitrite sensing domain-containing protein [Nonomuraea ferruginea]|uniref:histidine kinase n=1 Tax=Nonomuraea ferruginea TaxID=46174 RepID=A0ABT4SUB7_9ACTN|nr:nitrate- and nitrite sensing domain-containing protein [Nonomuraea ferruginea]MDA0640724.1 nitrate- and nitrite sensing domain-containing protein [Nonomuraea ferruginea]
MRSRLVALIAVPTAVGVALGGLNVITSLQDANTYQTLREVAELSESLGAVSHALAAERDETALYIAQGRPDVREPQLRGIHNEVDDLIADVRQRATAVNDTHGDAVRPVLRRLEEIRALRDTAVEGKIQPLPTIVKYSQINAGILQFHDQLGQVAVDDVVAHTAGAMAAIARAKEQASRQRGILASALDKKSFDAGELDSLTTSKAREESEETLFATLATQDQLELFRNVVVGQDIDQTDLFRLRAIAQSAQNRPLSIGTDPAKDVATWFDVSSGKIEAMRKVETSLSSSLILRARALEDGANRAALISAGLIMILLLVVLAVITLIARSLIRPLRRLRREALDVANHRLPETVRTLRDSGDATPAPVAPIGVKTEDEIGEVARAFDEVHREAVRLAGEEARLRANVNAMFVNLSRRSQTLVERQITLIDGLEQGEQDEQRLANLFKLDHLATRMRRNSENLLVLAGQEPPRRWSQPVKMVDVARASLSEVENYERVVLQVPDGVSVAGQAVNDVIHLIAELVENALSFSPRETRVTVSGSRIDGGGVMLSISDSGIGMTQEELVQANERLAQTVAVDVSVSRRMGLFVVSRLAQRHGIRVQLRTQSGGGLTAMVLVPESLLGAQTQGFDGAAGAAGALAGMQRARAEAFTSPPPVPQWGDNGFQMSPAHPSYPGSAEPSGSWPATNVQWPSNGGGSGAWPSDPRGGGGFDTDDVWIPSRVPGSWTNEQAPPIERPADPLPTRNPANRGKQAYDFPETAESGATGPMPAVNASSGGDDYLPIFASVESAWFERGGSSGAWGSAKADAGWTAAQAAAEPVRDGATASGLPKRVPKANLVPGSADTAAAPKGVAPMPAISPDRVRSRLASFQKGFRAARDDISEGRANVSDPRENREEGA